MFTAELLLDHGNADNLACWPITWGLPLPPGELSDADHLQLLGPDGQIHAVQARALQRHGDGSVSRLLVHAEAPVPAESRQAFTLRQGSTSAPLDQPAAVDADGLRGAAGALQVTDGQLRWITTQASYRLEFAAVGRPADASDAEMTSQGAPLANDRQWEPLAWRLEAMEPFESGPIVVAAVLHGAMLLADQPLLAVRLTVRLFRRTPLLLCDVLAKNLSDYEAIELKHWELHLVREEGSWHNAEYEIRQARGPFQSKLPLHLRARKLSIEIQTPEQQRGLAGRLLNYNETWLAPTDGRGHLVLGLRNFFEYFPYGVRLEERRVICEFWPRWSGQAWKLVQGCGKTHQLALAPLSDETAFSARAMGYGFGKPPMPRVPLRQCHAAGQFTELLDYQPDRYPRLETMLFDLAYNRNRGYGKMNYGDDYAALYTNQLRGQGRIVWNNLEGDYPYHMFCQFLRTGRAFYFREFHNAIQHWADVDFCDRSRDPRRQGALIVHSAEHVTGHASPCHNWAEGFSEWYWAGGDPRPLEILGKMADWIVRQDAAGFFKTDPEPYVRGCGWGLIQMAAMQQVLRRPDLQAIMQRLGADLLNYCRSHHGLVMTMTTGGNWTRRDNAFHTATVVIGAYRCWQLDHDPHMRELALNAAEAFMDQRTCTPEGLAVYITGPEQDFPMQQAAGFAMGALACAYQLSGDRRYVRRGMRMLEYCLDRGMIVDHMRIPGQFLEFDDEVVLEVQALMPNSQLLNYQLRGLLLFMAPAHQTGWLQKVDYQF